MEEPVTVSFERGEVVPTPSLPAPETVKLYPLVARSVFAVSVPPRVTELPLSVKPLLKESGA